VGGVAVGFPVGIEVARIVITTEATDQPDARSGYPGCTLRLCCLPGLMRCPRAA